MHRMSVLRYFEKIFLVIYPVRMNIFLLVISKSAYNKAPRPGLVMGHILLIKMQLHEIRFGTFQAPKVPYKLIYYYHGIKKN